jgi:hypothetical protein
VTICCVLEPTIQGNYEWLHLLVLLVERIHRNSHAASGRRDNPRHLSPLVLSHHFELALLLGLQRKADLTSKNFAIRDRVAMGGETLLFSIWEIRAGENPVSLATACRVSFFARRRLFNFGPILYSLIVNSCEKLKLNIRAIFGNFSKYSAF